MKNEILICTNESLAEKDNQLFCENLDIKSIPEGLNDSNDITLLGRKSKKNGNHNVKIKNYFTANNIFSYLYFIIKKKRKNTNLKFFLISVTPFTLMASIIIFFLGKKSIIYLRSDGYEEYKSILGFLGPSIYHLMFTVAAITSNFISCRKHILKKKEGIVVEPSQLNPNWFRGTQINNEKKINLLYVGRIKVEKGIFSFLDIYNKINNQNIKLNIVTSEIYFKKLSKYKNLNLFSTLNEKDLIRKYDESKIFILPSFTEGHPQVLDEALSRNRPVIVFNEISHVKRDRYGVFVCDRNADSLTETINKISYDYEKIYTDIQKNKLPTKEKFLNQLKVILNKERWPSG